MVTSPHILPPLQQYLQATQKACENCIASVQPFSTLSGCDVTVKLHYIRFDGNDEPKFDQLAHTLVKHIIRYALSSRTIAFIKEREDYDESDLFLRARDLFRKVPDAGETGELLLFLLLESIYQAPQIICKMELKTNPGDEVKGSDAVHIKWDEQNKRLKVYLGESKLYDDISSAMSSTFSSLQTFYDQKRTREELDLVTAHFKHTNDEFKSAVLAYLNNEIPDTDYHVTHVCLIGWDWNKYKDAMQDRRQFRTGFEKLYQGYLSSITKSLTARIDAFKYKHLCMEFLFIPFRSVQQFRDEFYRVLSGQRAR